MLAALLDKRKLKLRLALGAVLFVVITGTTFTMFLHSEPYEYASHFAASDARVIEATGKPEKVSLRLTRPFRYTFGERNGVASMTLLSKSSRGEFDVELHLAKQTGRWTVSRAEVFPKGATPLLLVSEPCSSPCK